MDHDDDHPLGDGLDLVDVDDDVFRHHSHEEEQQQQRQHLHHHHHDDDEEEDEDDDENDQEEAPVRGNRKRKAKRDPHAMRKAPCAPKRFKSSYICFFMAKQGEIKEALGEDANVSSISKRSAEMWKTLSPEDRAHWDDVAAKDKERYMAEKRSYTGPWQVPWKRAKKDPSAPKRPMSAFLQFCQGRRTRLKEENPEMKNTQISRILGDMWKNASEEEKRPYVEKEKAEREKYKVAMAQWRTEFEAKQEAERKAQHQAQAYNPPMLESPRAPFYGDPYSYPAVAQHPHMHHQYPYGYPAGPYAFPTDGKQPVILGPNGTPVYPIVPSGEKEYEAEDTPKKAPPVEHAPSPSYDFHDIP